MALQQLYAVDDVAGVEVGALGPYVEKLDAIFAHYGAKAGGARARRGRAALERACRLIGIPHGPPGLLFRLQGIADAKHRRDAQTACIVAAIELCLWGVLRKLRMDDAGLLTGAVDAMGWRRVDPADMLQRVLMYDVDNNVRLLYQIDVALSAVNDAMRELKVTDDSRRVEQVIEALCHTDGDRTKMYLFDPLLNRSPVLTFDVDMGDDDSSSDEVENEVVDDISAALSVRVVRARGDSAMSPALALRIAKLVGADMGTMGDRVGCVAKPLKDAYAHLDRFVRTGTGPRPPELPADAPKVFGRMYRRVVRVVDKALAKAAAAASVPMLE